MNRLKINKMKNNRVCIYKIKEIIMKNNRTRIDKLGESRMNIDRLKQNIIKLAGIILVIAAVSGTPNPPGLSFRMLLAMK